MCEAMGRDITNVILGGAGTDIVSASGAAVEMEGEITTTGVDAVAEALLEAKNIIITPGYGLAVAQAQFAVADIAKKLPSLLSLMPTQTSTITVSTPFLELVLEMLLLLVRRFQ